jgi:hypothetical protein
MRPLGAVASIHTAVVAPFTTLQELDMSRRSVWLATILVLGAVTPARAQSGAPVEFGADAALSLLFDPSVVVINVPVSEVRIGFFLTPRVELEPRFRLVAARGDGADYSEAFLALGALFHTSTSRAAPQTYLRPFVSVSSIDFGSSGDSPSAVSLGVGVGVKRPIGNRFAFRPELNFAHTFERDGIEGQNRLQLLFGFSVYSH